MSPAPPSFLPADWPTPAKVRALATTRVSPGRSSPPFHACNLGARSGDDPATVLSNRSLVTDALALPSPPVWLNQVHGTDVLVVAGPLPAPRPIDREPVADAAVTRAPGAVLAVLSADCLPVLLAADDGSVVAAVHAGWRGLAAGVVEAALAAMAVAPARVLAWLGPAIGADHYEVGAEVRAAFVEADPDAVAAFAATRRGHWYCDLYALARRRLARAGVAAGRIHGGGLSTLGDPGRFHSHRRDGNRSGRQASLVWLAGD